MNILNLLLENDTTTTGATGGNGGSTLFMVVYLVVIFAAMYFLLIRPNRKKQKAEKQMRENLQVGDEIVTIGGVHGRVISLKEDTMVIESLSDHSKLTFSRWALQTNNTVHDDAPAK